MTNVKSNKAIVAAKPAAVKVEKSVKPEKIAKVKTPGIGDFVKAEILKGGTNEQILALVSEKFPESNTTNASVNWYRSKLRAEGEEVPSSRKPKAPKAPKVAKVKKEKASKSEGEGGF